MNDTEVPQSLLLTPENECLASEKPRRNKKYHIEDTMSVFLVGNQLFKIHRHFLVKESQAFEWMFLCPPPAGGAEGTSDERPIALADVTPAEFEALLDFFYEEKFQRCRASMREWINLLSISTRYDFQRLRDCAIDAIEHSKWPFTLGSMHDNIDPVEQIVLAEKHDIPHWLRIAYVQICERSDPLSESEARKLGYHTTALLARARETVRNPHHRVPSPPPQEPSSPVDVLDTPNIFPISFPTNGFYHDRHRVDAIVSEVLFPEPGEPE
ncbi:hypothetical protein DFH06DRAFT_1109508 [Mycena polygramma]|nr:hypothetical protein DFH06DRAFT_1109508 [Mycena polygramma]